MTKQGKKIIASVDLGTLKHTEGKAQDFLALGNRLFVFLVLCELFLAAGHIWVMWFPDPAHHEDFVTFLHLDREGNLPTWFSSTQFLLLAYIFFALYFLERYRHTGRLWFACAAGAVFLSLDEAAALHELLGTYLGIWFAKAPEGSLLSSLQYFPSYYWMLAYLPVALPLAFVVLKILSKELQAAFRHFFAGVVIYGTGAVVLDFLEGRYGTPDHTGIYIRSESEMTWLDVALAEEMMEMFGVSLIIYALVKHYANIRAVSNSVS